MINNMDNVFIVVLWIYVTRWHYEQGKTIIHIVQHSHMVMVQKSTMYQFIHQ